MILIFQVQDDKVCYTPLKDKCEAIQNFRFTYNIETDKSFMQHGQFPLFIFTRPEKITYTYM